MRTSQINEQTDDHIGSALAAFMFAVICGGLAAACLYLAYTGYHTTVAADKISYDHVVVDVTIGVILGFAAIGLFIAFCVCLARAVEAKRDYAQSL
ncbi:hypothetical protein HJC99_05880 [Candidatus Saccharibacteria bacterium]|nr:hypothetical protein [Candidatus Saccharibacteria bacterium]